LYGPHQPAAMHATAMSPGRRRRDLQSSGVFLPPSPPDSLPRCSPRRAAAARRPGAPRRPTAHAAVKTTPTVMPDGGSDVDVPLTPVTRRPRLTHPGCTTIKYNRRTNPELERRRTHFCHFTGTLVSISLAISQLDQSMWFVFDCYFVI